MNCILGDDAALDKNLQVISFLSQLVHVRKIAGVHLIVVSLSELFHWQHEMRHYCPTLSVYRLYTGREDSINGLKTLLQMDEAERTADLLPNVVLTTHCMLRLPSADFLNHVFWSSVTLESSLSKLSCLHSSSVKLSSLSTHFKLILTPIPTPRRTEATAEPKICRQAYEMLNFLHPDIFIDLQSFGMSDIRYLIVYMTLVLFLILISTLL